MMLNDTLTRLRELRLAGMAAAIEEQATNSASSALGFEERLALVVDREVHHRNDKRVAGLLKRARLKDPGAASSARRSPASRSRAGSRPRPRC
jgi:hypothetical protein